MIPRCWGLWWQWVYQSWAWAWGWDEDDEVSDPLASEL